MATVARRRTIIALARRDAGTVVLAVEQPQRHLEAGPYLRRDHGRDPARPLTGALILLARDRARSRSAR